MKKSMKYLLCSFVMAGLCLAACGRNNNQSEGAADHVEDTINTTEIDSVVSPDTVRPAL